MKLVDKFEELNNEQQSLLERLFRSGEKMCWECGEEISFLTGLTTIDSAIEEGGLIFDCPYCGRNLIAVSDVLLERWTTDGDISSLAKEVKEISSNVNTDDEIEEMTKKLNRIIFLGGG